MLCLVVIYGAHDVVWADDTYWSPATTLYKAPDGQPGDPIPLWYPSIIADKAGHLHVFWTVIYPLERSAVFYTHDDGKGWSDPIDVLVGNDLTSPNQSLRVVLDGEDRFHVIWTNGASLYYSYAHVLDSHMPQLWSPPEVVAVYTIGADLAVDDSGRIHVVYASLQSPYDVQYITSEALGAGWSSPRSLAQPELETLAYNRTSIAVGSKHIHVAWEQDQLPDGWPPQGVLYNSSSIDGNQWTDPIQLAGSGQGAPSLLLAHDQMHVVWYSTGDALGRYASRSIDNGITWQPTQVLADDIHGLLLGTPQFALDSRGTIHLAMSGAQNADDSTWYAAWQDDRWGDVSKVLPASPNNEQGLDIAVSQGHLLHLAWLDLTLNEIRYSMMDTGAPDDPPEVITRPTASTSLPIPLQVTGTTKSRSGDGNELPRPKTGSVNEVRRSASQLAIVSLSAAAALVFVISAVGVTSINRRKRE